MNRMLVLSVMTVVCSCAAQAGDEDDDFGDVSELSTKADSSTGNTKLVGTVALGFSRNVLYSRTPRYRAVKFHADAGTQLELFVRSKHGDPMMWLTDASLHTIEFSDDANEETNSNISIESLATSGDYYIVFRDKHLDSHYFEVAAVPLNLPANAPTVEQVEPVYETLVSSHALATKQVAASALPYLAKGLYDRWTTEVTSTPGLSVGAYALDVAGQRVWFIRKYLAGSGMEAGAYVASGPMIGVAGGASELIDSWEH